MKAVAHIQKILLAVAAAVTLVGANPRVEVSSKEMPPVKIVRVKCAGGSAHLVFEMTTNGRARVGVEKRVDDRLKMKMMQAGSMNWFESNGQIWINDQIRIDVNAQTIAIFAKSLPTDFAVDHRLCEERL